MSEFQDDDVVMHEWYDHEKHTTNISFEFTDRALVNDNTAKWLLKDLKMLWTEVANGPVSPAQTDTCTHHGIDSGGADYYGTSNPPQEADWNYAYCPNCGEKL